MKWTTKDQIAAREDGWVLSNFNVIWKVPMTLGKKGDAENKEILEYVKERAREGSELHKKALLLLIQRTIENGN